MRPYRLRELLEGQGTRQGPRPFRLPCFHTCADWQAPHLPRIPWRFPPSGPLETCGAQGGPHDRRCPGQTHTPRMRGALLTRGALCREKELRGFARVLPVAPPARDRLIKPWMPRGLPRGHHQTQGLAGLRPCCLLQRMRCGRAPLALRLPAATPPGHLALSESRGPAPASHTPAAPRADSRGQRLAAPSPPRATRGASPPPRAGASRRALSPGGASPAAASPCSTARLALPSEAGAGSQTPHRPHGTAPVVAPPAPPLPSHPSPQAGPWGAERTRPPRSRAGPGPGGTGHGDAAPGPSGSWGADWQGPRPRSATAHPPPGRPDRVAGCRHRGPLPSRRPSETSAGATAPQSSGRCHGEHVGHRAPRRNGA
jgi:hypothetical protein